MPKTLGFFTFTVAAAFLAPRLAIAGIADFDPMAASAEAKLILIVGAICLILAALAARRGDA